MQASWGTFLVVMLFCERIIFPCFPATRLLVSRVVLPNALLSGWGLLLRFTLQSMPMVRKIMDTVFEGAVRQSGFMAACQQLYASRHTRMPDALFFDWQCRLVQLQQSSTQRWGAQVVMEPLTTPSNCLIVWWYVWTARVLFLGM